MRSLLVTSSVGLATPLFTVGGIVRLWYHLPAGASKYFIALVLGGGVTTLVFIHVIPFHLDHAEVILPFALANALTAGGLYALLEKAVGFPNVLKVRWQSPLCCGPTCCSSACRKTSTTWCLARRRAAERGGL